jgi:hypothetical protein
MHIRFELAVHPCVSFCDPEQVASQFEHVMSLLLYVPFEHSAHTRFEFAVHDCVSFCDAEHVAAQISHNSDPLRVLYDPLAQSTHA